MRANPVELLVVNPAPRAAVAHQQQHNPAWARSLGRGMYRGTRYAAESARDVYRGVREAHTERSRAPAPTKNPGRKPKKRNPTVALPKRDSSGRFKKKVAAKKKAKKAIKKKAQKSRARRKKRRVVANIVIKANPKRRRRRAAKANPAMKRRRRRAVKANPAPMRRRRRRLAKKNPLSKRFQKRAKRTVAVLKKRKKKAPQRSLRRRALSAQVSRANAILSLARSRSAAKRIRPAIRGLQHAMMTKSNPGFAGVIASAKILAPQAAVGGLGLVALAMAGTRLAEMVTMEKDPAGDLKPRSSFADDKGSISTLGKYMPAISTAGLSVVGYMVADKVAPRFKGAVMIGGMIGAIVQAVMASVETGKDNWASSVKAALLPIPGISADVQAKTDAPAVTKGGIFHGLGEYTTVGSGIFHGLGEYTTVGSGGDNATEFAADSLRGLDDASHFAPGEGGVLSGGIFK
jgi:hypothetical protein